VLPAPVESALVASIEAFAHAEHAPDVHQQLAAGIEEGCFGLAELFHHLDQEKQASFWPTAPSTGSTRP
jgi:hypothetical protein